MQNNNKSVILLEFNELCPSLTHRFMSEGKLPYFSRFFNEAQIFISDAQEKAPNLEPWIQWVTVHSGLPFQQHGIFHLGDGHKLKGKCIWDVLSDAGFRVWICGSMNLRYDLPFNGYILPDPWTTQARPHPDSLLSYFRFVQKNVQEYTSDKVPLSRWDYMKFLTFMMTHGLSLSTVSSIVRQLLSEAIGRNRWKRATLLDKLQFDVFRSIYRKYKPQFSTFFLNSTAHFQHMYWRNMDPDVFEVKPSADEQAEYQEAILFGYQEMDKLVGRFLEMATENTVLILATALSQQPCLTYEKTGGKSFYRPRDFERLLAYAGVTAPHTISPVMSEQFHIFLKDGDDAITAERQLRALTVGGREALSVHRNGADLLAGCCIFDQLPKDVQLTVSDSDKAAPFFEIFYQVEGMKSGIHHPDGLLWIRDVSRKHYQHQDRVPLTSIAPTILDLLSAPRAGFAQDSLLSPREELYERAV